MKIKKLISVMIIAVMAVGAFSGCNNAKNKTETETTAPIETTVKAAVTTTAALATSTAQPTTAVVTTTPTETTMEPTYGDVLLDRFAHTPEISDMDLDINVFEYRVSNVYYGNGEFEEHIVIEVEIAPIIQMPNYTSAFFPNDYGLPMAVFDSESYEEIAFVLNSFSEDEIRENITKGLIVLDNGELGVILKFYIPKSKVNKGLCCVLFNPVIEEGQYTPMLFLIELGEAPRIVKGPLHGSEFLVDIGAEVIEQ